MALFSRSSRRPLATASGPRVRLTAHPDHFQVQWGEDQPQRIGWHQVHSGGWRQDQQEMHWRLLDGSRERVQLTEEGRFPEVFRERVQASIALEHHVDVPAGGTLLFAARRDLAPSAEPRLVWAVSASRGARLEDHETAALARETLARLRADYDL